jgi:hypothetical protein
MNDNFDLQKGDITKRNQIDQNVIGKKRSRLTT